MWNFLLCHCGTQRSSGLETGRTAQGLKAHAALRAEQSLVPSTHGRQLTTLCNSSPRGSDGLFCTPMHIHKETLTYTYRKSQVFRLGILILLKLVCKQENLHSNASSHHSSFIVYWATKRQKPLNHIWLVLKILTFSEEKNEIFPLLCWWNWLLISKYKTGIRPSHILIKIICNCILFKHIWSSHVLSGKLIYYGHIETFERDWTK